MLFTLTMPVLAVIEMLIKLLLVVVAVIVDDAGISH